MNIMKIAYFTIAQMDSYAKAKNIQKTRATLASKARAKGHIGKIMYLMNYPAATGGLSIINNKYLDILKVNI